MNDIEIRDWDAYLNGQKLSNDFMFVSDGTWYDKGSICWLDVNCGQMGGLFVGIKDGYQDGELCNWGEFDIYDNKRNLIKKAEQDEN